MATTGATHHRNIFNPQVLRQMSWKGAMFAVTKQELETGHEYEKAADYERVLVQLESGVSAWVYLDPEQ